MNGDNDTIKDLNPASKKKELRSKSMLSKTGKLRSGYEEITPPHLALMKIEIQAKGWVFLCSLDFLVLLWQDKRTKQNPEVANFG
jgi:hypothetical protein